MKQEDTKQRILDKALELFSTQGYDSVSVENEAKDFGQGLGVVFHAGL